MTTPSEALAAECRAAFDSDDITLMRRTLRKAHDALRSAPVPSVVAVEKAAMALDRARTVLGNMAAENEGAFGAFFGRWPIHHEPLRGDAKRLLPVIDDVLALLTPAETQVDSIMRRATEAQAERTRTWPSPATSAAAETAPHPAGGDDLEVEAFRVVNLVKRLRSLFGPSNARLNEKERCAAREAADEIESQQADIDRELLWHNTVVLPAMERAYPDGPPEDMRAIIKTIEARRKAEANRRAQEAAEIERLRAQVATIRREAIEEAAKLALALSDDESLAGSIRSLKEIDRG